MASQTALSTSEQDGSLTDRRNRAPSQRILFMDRSQAFARARRHSILVRTLRLLLPVSAVLMAGGYVGWMVTTARIGAAIERKGQVTTLNRELAMDNPRYEGLTKEGGRFLVTARTALPELSNSGRIKLNEITAELVDVRKARTDITAARGVFDSKSNLLDLTGGITVATQSGMRADLDTATIATRDGTMRSSAPVRVTAPQGTIRSGGLELDQKAKTIGFVAGVAASLAPPPRPAEAGEGPPGGAKATSVGKPAGPFAAFGGAREPVDVTADRLDIDDAGKTAVFSGFVKAGQAPAGSADLTGAAPVPAATIETARLEISYAGNVQPPVAPLNVPPDAQPGPASGPDGKVPGGSPPPKPTTDAAKIERIFAPGPVVLTQGIGSRITGNSAQFDAIGEVGVVSGNVIMTAGVDRRASSEHAEFNQRADTILLTGNVIVTQAGNELRGRRLFVDRKSGRTELTAAAETGVARSRIFARLIQGSGSAKTAAKAAVAPAAAEVAGGLGFATFKTDPNAPVNIEADRLVVEDGRKEATFSGDVKAAQGDFLIKSSELKAIYSGETGLVSDPTAAPPASPAGGKTAAQLTRIDARGNVEVTSKAAQKVTGDWAIFDTKANTVTVGGGNVILTQGPNVIKGNKLVIDMGTGLSVIKNDGVVGREAVGSAGAGTTGAGAASVATGQAAAGQTGTSVRPGRSSVILYPSTLGKKPAVSPPTGAEPAGRAAAPQKPSASSWGATAEPPKPDRDQ